MRACCAAMMMQWEKLLSPNRLGKKKPERQEPQRSPFQRDYDRVIFSAAFRRLQDKTQVFPLAESDYVRTRLTHSLEAASVGRSMGTEVGMALGDRLPQGVHPSDVGAIVAAACLGHDIGNPPFGHSGEDAIRHWFTTSPVAAEVQGLLSAAEARDFERFEGNAQGFRVLTRLQMPDNVGGLQLTCATLGAFAKYPLHSSVDRAGCEGVSMKKFSFFAAEAPFFAEVAEETGLLPRSEGGGWWCRHPLAFLVEAADDVCYRLVDFEDGVQVGILDYEEVRDAFVEVIGKPEMKERVERMQGRKERLEFLRAMAIGAVIGEVAKVFLAHHDALMAGEYEQSLIDATRMAGALRAIQKRSQESIYVSSRGIEIEAAGFEVIAGLLDLFVGAVEELAAVNAGRIAKVSARARTLSRLVPEQFIGPNRVPDKEAYVRLLRMTDFVAGMTDSYAVTLYKKVRGISLPGQ